MKAIRAREGLLDKANGLVEQRHLKNAHVCVCGLKTKGRMPLCDHDLSVFKCMSEDKR